MALAGNFLQLIGLFYKYGFEYWSFSYTILILGCKCGFFSFYCIIIVIVIAVFVLLIEIDLKQCFSIWLLLLLFTSIATLWSFQGFKLFNLLFKLMYVMFGLLHRF